MLQNIFFNWIFFLDLCWTKHFFRGTDPCYIVFKNQINSDRAFAVCARYMCKTVYNVVIYWCHTTAALLLYMSVSIILCENIPNNCWFATKQYQFLNISVDELPFLRQLASEIPMLLPLLPWDPNWYTYKLIKQWWYVV